MPRFQKYYWLRVAGLPVHILESFDAKAEMFEDAQQIKAFYQDQRLCLQKISHHPILQNGLTLASPSLLQRLGKYQKTSIEQFKKKEGQTEHKIFQYLNRTLSKTSPFSSLTALACFDSEKQVFLKPKYYSKVSLSKTIDLQGKATSTIISINPTLLELEDSYHFLVEKNREIAFQILEKDENLAQISDCFSEAKTIDFQSIIKKIQYKIKVSKQEIGQYLAALLEIGFLQENQVFNPSTFVQKLEKSISTAALTTFLEDWKDKIKNTSTSSKKTFKKQVFYQDCATTFELKKSPKPSLENIKLELQKLLQLLAIHHPLQKEKLVLECLKKHFKNSPKIPLTLFIKTFLEQDYLNKNPLAFVPPQAEELVKIFEQNKGKNSIKISWNKLDFLSAKTNNPYPQELDFLVQFVYPENAVINGIALGHGKLAGRFFDLFDEAILQEQLKKNTLYRNDELWVQNQDNSLHNANPEIVFFPNQIHPNDINIHQLEIHWDGKKYQLADKFSGKKVRILDMGLEHPNQRSVLYQILNLFGFESPRLEQLTQPYQSILLQQKEFGILYHPRIELGKLIIQHAYWKIDASILPTLGNQNNGLYKDSYLKLRSFLLEKKLAQHFFFHFESPKTKPQYINLNSPMHLLFLAREVLKSTTQQLVCTEMIPQPNEILGNNVNEWIISS